MNYFYSTVIISIWLVGIGSTGWFVVTANADEPVVTNTSAVSKFKCRVFPVDLNIDISLDTHDATTPIGQWVRLPAHQGWEVTDIDLEVGQKPTGYPTGWVNVCLRSPGSPS